MTFEFRVKSYIKFNKITYNKSFNVEQTKKNSSTCYKNASSFWWTDYSCYVVLIFKLFWLAKMVGVYLKPAWTCF